MQKVQVSETAGRRISDRKDIQRIHEDEDMLIVWIGLVVLRVG